jgi:hypothetical protein
MPKRQVPSNCNASRHLALNAKHWLWDIATLTGATIVAIKAWLTAVSGTNKCTVVPSIALCACFPAARIVPLFLEGVGWNDIRSANSADAPPPASPPPPPPPPPPLTLLPPQFIKNTLELELDS